MVSTILWWILGLALCVLIVASIIAVFNFWLFDFIVDNLIIIEEIFWSWPVYIALSFLWLWFTTLVFRFVMSWIGENPWSSANK